ncbi:DNA (cytosine-5-)-methyltransferase [Candidatus Njordibacter sp. Uisw_039]|uniref:DNA cytosine methyltransferase n=1 Tax=Candidatus Njordibacter sp. Uisw_039 TaxID=3230972 RepID=UPI003D4110EF
MKVLSLFSGCGGLDLGFALEGYEIVAAFDHWGPAVECHNYNERLLGGRAEKKSLALDDGEIDLKDLPNVDVVLGGPPCQGFSFAGKQRIDDPRNKLYLDFKRIVAHVQPRVFLMENVKGLEKMALNEVQKSFHEIGYQVTIQRVDCTLLGLAQRRERIIIIGTKESDKKFQTPDILLGSLFGGVQTPVDLFSVIGDLPMPTSGRGLSKASTHYLDDHKYLPFSALEKQFIPHIPNGGCFRDAPRDVLPDRLVKILDDPARYKNPRLFPKADPYKPAQTVPASTSPSIGGVIAPDLIYENNLALPVIPSDYIFEGRYTSPVESRRFTAREAARLQGFPDSFLFTGSLSSKTKMIGNAVPVPLGRLFAKEIKAQIFS